MTSSYLKVVLSDEQVGTLERNRDGLTTWDPSSQWEARGQHPRLGITFLRTPGMRRAGTGLPAWFDNLLPEPNSALRQRLCAVHGLRSNEDFRLLSAIGRDLTGAAEVTDSGATNLTENSTSPPDIASEIADSLRFSLAGMQLKFSMSAAGDRMVLGASGPDGHWIVKLPGAGYEDLPEVEKATMTWAHLAGFDVPQHRTMPTTQLVGIPASWHSHVPTAYAIRRFDRRDDGSKIHQEDLCQAFDIRSADKYGDINPRHITLDSAVKLVGDAAGDDAAREMCRRIGFVVASGNDDAHLKNWSFLWGNATRPKLAPCYDFVATVSWPDQHGWGLPNGPTLALKLGREKLFARLTREVLDAHAALSGYDWATEEVLLGIERARDTWTSAASHMPSRMREALVEHWARVPILQGMRPAGMSPVG